MGEKECVVVWLTGAASNAEWGFHRRELMQQTVSEASRIVRARATLGLPCDPEGPLVDVGVWSGEGWRFCVKQVE